MEELTHLSLFTGIAGIDIAAEWAGFKTVCFVENNAYCQKVLRKHWPDVPIIGDVKDVTKEKIMEYTQSNGLRQGGASISNKVQRENRTAKPQIRCGAGYGITLISGGFPCQPHSVAGKRQGSADSRNLWPEFRRIIGEIKPGWVLAENVPGLFSSDAGRFFGSILNDLAEMGYSTGWATYGAVDVGALHRRNRVFIVAYAGGERQSAGESRGLREISGRRPYNSCTTSESDIVAHSGCFNSDWRGSQCGGQEETRPCDRITRPSKYTKDVADTESKPGDGFKDNPRNSQRPQAIPELRNTGRQANVVNPNSNGLSQHTAAEEIQSEGRANTAIVPTSARDDSTQDVADTAYGSLSSWGARAEGITEARRNWQASGTRFGSIDRTEYDSQWAVERRLGKFTDGIPERLDNPWREGWEEGTPRVTKNQKNRVDRLKALGNAVVPQQIYPVLKAIADIERSL